MGCFILRHILRPELLERDVVCNHDAFVISNAFEKHRGNGIVLAEVSVFYCIKLSDCYMYLSCFCKACRAVLELVHASENIAQMLVKHHCVHMHLFRILEGGPDGSAFNTRSKITANVDNDSF